MIRVKVVDENGDFLPNESCNDYDCPECDETLFTDDKEAEKFLRGDK
jgi:hypothetical protein